jgi:enoyl-CoA hydratase/carnithine racemase
MEERVSISISDGIADVRLVRADKMNALDTAMFEARCDLRAACRREGVASGSIVR